MIKLMRMLRENKRGKQVNSVGELNEIKRHKKKIVNLCDTRWHTGGWPVHLASSTSSCPQSLGTFETNDLSPNLAGSMARKSE